MLSRVSRLTSPADFRAVMRRGRRVGTTTLVVHLLAPLEADEPVEPTPPRVGFVVSRAVGGAVVRNRVTRRLRHLVRPELDRLPAGTRLVVRALPPAAQADSRTLGQDLTRSLVRAVPCG